MLYKTTREINDAYTAYRALHENAAPDGGAFVPFRMPSLTAQEIDVLASGGFSAAVAEIINKFFSTQLTAWDVDFYIGRNALKLESVPHRMLVAELWHNPDGNLNYLCNALYNKVCNSIAETPTECFLVASHIAVLFGIYCEMRKNDAISAGDTFDVTVLANKLSMPVAALYARQMGLPIESIILTCEDDGNLWDMINLGELSAAASNSDPVGIERFIHASLGYSGVEELRKSLCNQKTFRISEEQLMTLREGVFCSVVGNARGMQNINSVYRSNNYIMDISAALAVSGVQDFRAKTGESRLTLVLACTSPNRCLDSISSATGISRDNLAMLLKNPKDR